MSGLGRKKVDAIMNLLTLKCLHLTQLGCSLAVEGTFVGSHKRRQTQANTCGGHPQRGAVQERHTGRKQAAVKEEWH